jgi:hypothetical protein
MLRVVIVIVMHAACGMRAACAARPARRAGSSQQQGERRCRCRCRCRRGRGHARAGAGARRLPSSSLPASDVPIRSWQPVHLAGGWALTHHYSADRREWRISIHIYIVHNTRNTPQRRRRRARVNGTSRTTQCLDRIPPHPTTVNETASKGAPELSQILRARKQAAELKMRFGNGMMGM